MFAHSRTLQNIGFALLFSSSLAVFWTPLNTLIRFSLQHDQYSHILLVPIVSLSLLVLERRRIFAQVETCWGLGSGLILAGVLLYSFGLSRAFSWSENDQLSLAISSLVTIWVGGFILCYGPRAFRLGLLPMLFLYVMVPIPDVLLNRVIFWLQVGSAEVSYAMFQLLDVPVLRTGLIFSLPGVTIQVTEECSGIRSGVALLIVSLLAGHLFLRSAGLKTLLILATIPLLLVKNGIRIVTLSLLSIYVDPGFLTGSLHRSGGILFFILALVILAPVLWILQRSKPTASPAP